MADNTTQQDQAMARQRAEEQQAASAAQAAPAPERSNDPGALVAGSEEHRALEKKLPSRDRQLAYNRMRAAAQKKGGNYTLTDKNGQTKTLPVEEAISLIEANNAKGIPMVVNGAGTSGGQFLFQPTGKPSAEAEKKESTDKAQEQEKKSWWERNKGWLIPVGLALVGGLAAFFLSRRKKDKSSPATAVASNVIGSPTTEAPTTEAPTIDNSPTIDSSNSGGLNNKIEQNSAGRVSSDSFPQAEQPALSRPERT